MIIRSLHQEHMVVLSLIIRIVDVIVIARSWCIAGPSLTNLIYWSSNWYTFFIKWAKVVLPARLRYFPTAGTPEKAEPLRLEIQSGLNPQPRFRFFWGAGGWEMPQAGGEITFAHLMKVYQFNDRYIKLVKDGPAMHQLRAIYNHVHYAYYKGQDDHMFLMKRADDHPLINPLMELVGWTSLPSLSIWDTARAALNKAEDACLNDQWNWPVICLSRQPNPLIKPRRN